VGEREKSTFLAVFLLSEGLLEPGWGRGVSALFTHEFGRAPSSWLLGTLARRSSSRRRLLNRLVWALCKIGSRFACFSIAVGNDFCDSSQRSNSLSSGISLPERKPSARSASGVGRHQFKFLAGAV